MDPARTQSCLPWLAQSEQNAHTMIQNNAFTLESARSDRVSSKNHEFRSAAKPAACLGPANTRIMHGARRPLLRAILVTSMKGLPLHTSWFIHCIKVCKQSQEGLDAHCAAADEILQTVQLDAAADADLA